MELYAALRSSALAKCHSSNSESKGYVAVLTNEALNLGCLWIKAVRVEAKDQPQSGLISDNFINSCILDSSLTVCIFYWKNNQTFDTQN